MRGGRSGSTWSGRTAVSVTLVVAALAAHGCGDDDGGRKVASYPDAGSEPDSGPDASDSADASRSKDATTEDDDAGSSASGGKGGHGGKGGSGGKAGSGSKAGAGGSGGTSASGSGGSGGSTETPPEERCLELESDNSWSTTVMFGDDTQYALTTGTTGFGIAFGGMPGCDDIQVAPVQSSGAWPMPQSVLGDDCSVIRDLSMLHVASGWRVAWLDNSSGSLELQGMLLSEDMSMILGDMRTRLTDNMLTEQRPVLASLNGVPYAAFIAKDPETNKLRISSVEVDTTPNVKDVLPENDTRKPVALAFRQIGKSNAVVAWTDEIGSGTQGVWLQATDLSGAPTGSPQQVSNLVSSGTTVDLAARDAENEGGAIVYSVNLGDTSEVRFRRLSNTGEVLADEVKVVSGVLQGRDASVARLGGGYVIAYRALPGGSVTEGEVRLTIVSKEGTLMRDSTGNLYTFKVASAGSGGGRTTLRVSNEGNLLVGFVDGDSSMRQLRLVRKRLDCPL